MVTKKRNKSNRSAAIRNKEFILVGTLMGGHFSEDAY
jgi:hypothetical protein